MAEILSQDTVIPARDGYPLAATAFAPPAPPQRVVLINSATAVPRRIYRGLATYLAERGFAAVTYDYRGVAGSRPRSFKGFDARMRDWAALDASAAIDHMRNVWPAAALTVVGHSFGGQALGLAPNNSEVSRALLVAAQAGYWRLFAAPEKYRVYVLMRFIGVPVARALGYVPGRFGIGEDVPRGVFLEWTGWVRKPRYFFDDARSRRWKIFPASAAPSARSAWPTTRGPRRARSTCCAQGSPARRRSASTCIHATSPPHASGTSDSSGSSTATRCGATRRTGWRCRVGKFRFSQRRRWATALSRICPPLQRRVTRRCPPYEARVTVPMARMASINNRVRRSSSCTARSGRS